MLVALLRVGLWYGLIGFASSQFGEIASVVTGLLSSGGGLAGLASSGGGLAGLTSSGASAGAGAASALSGIGPLYQLAQAALQLTDTGIGIANQASESAWFPVAVENAARMNRDFQERLLKGAPPPGIETGAAGRKTFSIRLPSEKVGGEYGTNFESGEELTSSGEVESTIPHSTDKDYGPFPSSARLPGLVSLLPGESSVTSRKNSTKKSHMTKPEKSDLPLALGEDENDKPSPRINIEFPSTAVAKPTIKSTNGDIRINYDYEDKARPTIDFNTDEQEQQSTTFTVDDGELLNKYVETTTTIPLRKFLWQVAAAKLSDGNDTTAEEALHAAKIMAQMLSEEMERKHKISQMIPELKNLVSELRKGNLTREEFIEISNQLKINTDPRINTTPKPTTNAENANAKDLLGGGADTRLKIINAKHELASRRNLNAFRIGLDDTDPVLHNIAATRLSSPVVLTLPSRHRINSTAMYQRSKVHIVPSHPHHIQSTEKNIHKLPLRITSYDYEKESQSSTNLIEKPSTTVTIPSTTFFITTTSPLPTIATTLSFAQQQQEIFNRHQQHFYNDLYRNYLNIYYPPYAAQYYGTQNVYNLPVQYSAPIYSPNQGQQLPQHSLQNNANQYWQEQPKQKQYYHNIPPRIISQPVLTTPASALQHPYSKGSLITLMQPYASQPQQYVWPFGR